jgi:hypothetical protein
LAALALPVVLGAAVDLAFDAVAFAAVLFAGALGLAALLEDVVFVADVFFAAAGFFAGALRLAGVFSGDAAIKPTASAGGVPAAGADGFGGASFSTGLELIASVVDWAAGFAGVEDACDPSAEFPDDPLPK